MSSVSQRLKKLAETIESLESCGAPVTEISTSADDTQLEEGLTASFSVEIPLPLTTKRGENRSDFHPTEAEVKEDGSVIVAFEGEVTTQNLESLCVTNPLDLSSVEKDMTIPAHRDPDTLQDVYDECDTFAAMKEALGTDVTAEAVRQQMIKHGIHQVPATDSPEDHAQPDVSETETSMSSNPAEDTTQQESDVVVSDGGFPVELTVSELKDIVKSSRTIYEATQALPVDQEEARELLERLNLLDLITGRLSTRDEQTVSGDEIEQRIRTSGITLT